MKTSEMLVTKSQAEQIMKNWECTEKLPKKGARVFVAWPKPTTPDLAVIDWTEKKTYDGKRLYAITMGMANDLLFGDKS